MEGVVLYFDEQTQQGTLKSLDGSRFDFERDDWKAPNVPEAGQKVDFLVENNKAKEIYWLADPQSSASSPAVSSQQAQVSTTSSQYANAPLSEKLMNLFNQGMFNKFGVIACVLVFVSMFIKVYQLEYFNMVEAPSLFSQLGLFLAIPLILLTISFYGGISVIYLRILGSIILALILFQYVLLIVNLFDIFYGYSFIDQLAAVIIFAVKNIFWILLNIIPVILLAIAIFVAKYNNNEKTI